MDNTTSKTFLADKSAIELGQQLEHKPVFGKNVEIEATVLHIAEELIDGWECVAEVVPSLQLDFSWFSIGTVEAICRPLRHSRQLRSGDEVLLDRVSCYLGIAVAACWQHIPEVTAVKVSWDDAERELVCSMRGGRLLGAEEEFRVNLRTLVAGIVVTPPVGKIAVMGDLAVQSQAEHGILSAVMLGVFAGITPHGIGALAKVSLENAGEYVLAAERYLAETCREHYGRIYTDELLGAELDLYLQQVIFPPFGSGKFEPFPGVLATTHVLRYLINNKALFSEMIDLSKNMLLSSDEQISSLGFCLLGTLMGRSPCEELQAFVDASPNVALSLRPAMIAARHQLGKPFDWQSLLELGMEEDALNLLETERQLGLLPLWVMPSAFLLKQEFSELHLALSWSALEKVRQLVAGYEKQGFVDVVLKELDLYCALIVGDRGGAEARVKELKDMDAASRSPWRQFLFGWELLERDCEDDALELFETAIDNVGLDRWSLMIVGEKLFLCYQQRGEVEKSLKLVNKVTERAGFSITWRMFEASVYNEMGDEDSVSEIQESLLKYAGIDSRVLTWLLEG